MQFKYNAKLATEIHFINLLIYIHSYLETDFHLNHILTA